MSPDSRWEEVSKSCLKLSNTKIASQNRSDHGGHKRARSNHSAAEIAGFFNSPAAKKIASRSRFLGLASKSQEARSGHGRKSPQLRDFVAPATTGHWGLKRKCKTVKRDFWTVRFTLTLDINIFRGNFVLQANRKDYSGNRYAVQ